MKKPKEEIHEATEKGSSGGVEIVIISSLIETKCGMKLTSAHLSVKELTKKLYPAFQFGDIYKRYIVNFLV